MKKTKDLAKLQAEMLKRQLLGRGVVEKDNVAFKQRRFGYDLIYFILGRKTGLVKIGVANYPRERLAALQVGSPDKLELIATESGSYKREGELHSLFAEYRQHGEWFSYQGKLRFYIETLPHFLPKLLENHYLNQ